MAKSVDILTQLRDLYASLTLGKKISFVLFMLLGVSMFLGVTYFARQPTFRVLYSNLSAEDLSGIVGSLKEEKVEYRIGAGGDSISVDEQSYYEVKMSLASAGLPRGGSTGFELFDQKSIGMTDFQQRVFYLRALQGELERTINKIATVENSRVHLVMPKEALFKEDQREPTASIILRLKTNVRLTNEEIEGITFLVAGSVEGLDSGDVTMLDSRGRVMSKKKSDDVAGPVNSAMIDYRRRLEAGKENRIVELISRIVGPEKVAAKVTATLDFRMVTKIVEHFDPDNQVARSEQIKDELSKDSELMPTGAPGVASNLPEGAGGGSAASNNQSERKLETINYEIGKTVSNISEPVGELKKLSVAVLVDGAYKIVKGDDDVETKTYVPRTKEEIQQITTLVKNAIGFSAERGDQLVVENVQFNPGFEAPATLPLTKDRMRYKEIANYILYGILLLIVAVMAFTMMRFLTHEPSYQAVGEMAGLLPSRVGELETKIAGRGPRMIARTEEDEETRIDIEQERHKRLAKQREELKTNLSKDDKAVTLMVRKWLKELKQKQE